MPDSKPTDVQVALSWVLLANDVLGYPLRAGFRLARGFRCDTLMVKVLSLAAYPFVIIAGGGGHRIVVDAFWYAMIALMLLQHVVTALFFRRKYHTRFIGRPLPEVFGLPMGLSVLFVEPLLWFVVGAYLRLTGEPGLGAYLWLAAITGPIEYLVIRERDQTFSWDEHDARIEFEFQRRRGSNF